MGPGAPPERITQCGAYVTSVFVVGWATGGLIFGAVGDRMGRARALAITMLLYGLCTGLSGFSMGIADFYVYRFVTGLGVGGVFGLAVALCADSLPDDSRPRALGLLQALSAVGNIFAGVAAVILGWLGHAGAWRLLPIQVGGAGEMGGGSRTRQADRSQVRLLRLLVWRGALAQARPLRHVAVRGRRGRFVGRRVFQPRTGQRCDRQSP